MKITHDDSAIDGHAATTRATAPAHEKAKTPAASISDAASLLSDSAAVLLERARSIHLNRPATALDLKPQANLNSGDDYHADDLLRYHGRHFVDQAHVALLKRHADASELDGFTDEILSGRKSKVNVLETLHASAEGRAAQVRLKGLPSSAKRRLTRLPFIGYLLRLLKGIWQLPVMIDEQRRFEAYVLARQQDIAEQKGEQLYVIVEDMAETLVMLAEELHKTSAHLTAASKQHPDHAASLDRQPRGNQKGS